MTDIDLIRNDVLRLHSLAGNRYKIGIEGTPLGVINFYTTVNSKLLSEKMNNCASRKVKVCSKIENQARRFAQVKSDRSQGANNVYGFQISR
jgi:hypothetical protein